MFRVVLACCLLLPQLAMAQEYYFPNVTPLWIAPERAFALGVPRGWQVFEHKNDRTTFEFRPIVAEGDPVLYLRRIRVPRGAHPRQLRLTAIEQRLGKMPLFVERARKDVTVNGLPAAAITGRYYYQGNVEYPRVVEELYVVKGEEAFVFHFDCFEGTAHHFADPVNKMYKSFVIRPPTKLKGSEVPPAMTDPWIDPDYLP